MSWQEQINQNWAKLGRLLNGVLSTETTWDPAATAATQGAEVTTTVTVTGATPGDAVQASHPGIVGLAAIIVGQVTAADTVTVRVINTTAVAVNVPSGILRVTVFK